MLSIYCRCGAQWHHKYAEHNGIIELHANGQGLNRSCHLVDHTTFKRLHPKTKCMCKPCIDARRRKPKNQPLHV